MKVSVAIITYNHEPFIRQTLDSVLSQELPYPWEIVIGEDNSTDGTRAVVKEYAERHPDRIRLLLPDVNLGMMKNFAQVLQACRGDYIATVEGDDFWTSTDKLRRQVEFLDSTPEAVLCHHRVTAFDHTSGKLLYDFPPDGFRQPLAHQKQLLEQNFIQTCALMFRRRDLPTLDAGFLELKLGDWPLCVLLSQNGRIGYVDENMARYRIHPASSWSSKPEFWRWREGLRMHLYLHRRLRPAHEDYYRGSITAAFSEGVHGLMTSGETDNARAMLKEWFNWSVEAMSRPTRTWLEAAIRAYSPKLWNLLGRPGDTRPKSPNDISHTN